MRRRVHMCVAPAVQALVFLSLACAVAAQCNGARTCAAGFFCSQAACVQCTTNSECSVGCVCLSGSCSCNAAAGATAQPPTGTQCTTNSDCTVAQYCALSHCQANGALSGCSSAPLVGRCVAQPAGVVLTAAPPPAVVPTPAPQGPVLGTCECNDDAYTWRTAFIVVAALLGLAVLALVIYICIFIFRDKPGKGDDTDTVPLDPNATREAVRSGGPDGRAPGRTYTESSPSPRGALTSPRSAAGGGGRPQHGRRAPQDRGTAKVAPPPPATESTQQQPPRAPGLESGVSVFSDKDGDIRVDDSDYVDVVVWFNPDEKLGLLYQGRLVTGVVPGMAAEANGVKKGMLIRSIDGAEVLTERKQDSLRVLFGNATKGEVPFPVGFRSPADSVPLPVVHVGDAVEAFEDGAWVAGVVDGERQPDGSVAVAIPGRAAPLQAARYRRAGEGQAFDKVKSAQAHDLSAALSPPSGQDRGRRRGQSSPRDSRRRRPATPPEVPAAAGDGGGGDERARHPSDHTSVAAVATSNVAPPSSSAPPAPPRRARPEPRSMSSSSSRSRAADLPPGTAVAANFNGTWFEAVVTGSVVAADGETLWSVQWAMDGSNTDGLLEEELRRLYAKHAVVASRFKKEWWKATVVDMAANCTYTLQWEDGTLTYGVRDEDIRLLPP